MNRRRFIRTSSGLLATSTLGGLVAGCAEPASETEAPIAAADTLDLSGSADDPWRLAICNEIMQDWDWERQCRYARSVGYEGIEVAPFTLADHVDDISKAEREQLRATAEAAGIEVLGLHWLLVTPEDLHVTTGDREVWRQSWDYMVKLAEFCADLGGKVMIFGSPNQRSSVDMTPENAVENMIEGLKYAAPQIEEHGVQLLLEPLSSDQTDVINTLGDAVEVVQAVDHPAVSAMFDFHNTADETEPLPQLIREYYDYIEHIQIQEMDGTYLGTGTGVDDFVPALETFKELGYDGWISLEVFDFEPGPEKIATVSMATMQEMMARV